ncbi:MAG: hypothetical protein RET84_20380 [Pseudomonadota bacterium]|nr:hypothetical protein [Pseudomonadota bacterium]MDQ8000867.1 hypothetical protein [Pseudomonadota bacterium]MDQ8018074.1 hypothetical protein [Pseudomonadota bacterium]MDQ8021948.1 hypothetical protein [Moraxellaceae bacterium]
MLQRRPDGPAPPRHLRAIAPAADGPAAADPPPRGLSAHILPTSATMIGVCMTVLSIGHLRRGGDSRVVLDKLLAVDALIFLTSAVLSFMSMRSRRAGRPQRYEGWAESVFLLGLGVLALAAVVLAFAIE